MTPSILVVPRLDRRKANHMLLMRIDRWDVRRDGALSDAALQQKVRSLGFMADARVYPAGAVVATQPDPRERIQAVASGLVKITIDGESAIVTAGDIVFVPRGAVRRLEVIGNTAAHCLEGRAQRASDD
jgi:quercetin dioxygenase-like cupin family protein